MATLKQATTLKHRANLGEEAQEIHFAEGEEVTVLKAWSDRCLCRTREGQLLNIPRTLLILD